MSDGLDITAVGSTKGCRSRKRALLENQSAAQSPGSVASLDADLPAAAPAPIAEFDARERERQQARDTTYRRLVLDAQACARSILFSPQLDSPEEWETTVEKALADYRSGRALMEQLGADRLLDASTAGMLLAIRRSLIDETNATSAGELVLIDMAVIAYANAMRLQSMIGNTALIIEAEMFGQPSNRSQEGRLTRVAAPTAGSYGRRC